MRRCRLWSLPVVLVLTSSLLAGCWHALPLEKRGLVPLLAIDTAAAGGYRVTVALIQPPGLAPPGPTGGGGTQGGTPVFLRTASAATMVQAIHAITSRTYLYMDFTHLEAVIVSRSVAQHGLTPALEYLARSLEFSQTGWLLVARAGSAAGLLRATQKDLPQPNEVLSQTARWTRLHTPYHTARLMTAFKEMPLSGVSFVTAGVAAGPSSAGPQSVPWVIGGDALFRRDQLVGWLHGPAALGWALAMNRLRYQAVTVQTGPARADLEVIGVARRVEVARDGSGTPRVTLVLSVDAHIASLLGAGNFSRAPGQLRALERAAGQVLASDVRQGLAEAQAAGSDAFGLGEYVRLHDPAYWSRIRSHWAGAAFRSLPVRVRVRVRITSVGEILCPLVHSC